MMKRAVLLMVALCLVLSVSALGQDDTKMLSAFGLKGGLNLANFSGDIENNKSMVAFGGGVFGKITPSPTICIQPEVLFMQKGAEDDVEGGEKLKLNYIEVPVLVKYMIPTEGNINPSIFAGPAVSFLMSADYGDEDMKDYIKSVDFGLAFGAGADIAIGDGGGKVTFDGRYTLGLSNINDADDSDEISVKNGVITFMVGYAFPLGN